MPSLQVRNLPEYIYRKLVEKATSEHRSIAQQTIILLKKALYMDRKQKQERTQIIDQILKSPPVTDPAKIPDPVELIRADRSR